MTNIPREVTIQGDIRFLPFTPAAEIKRRVEGYVADLNERIIRSNGLPHTGGVDRFVIPDPIQAKAAKAAGAGADSVPMLQGVLDWSWSAVSFTGVACDMESYGYRALCDSIYEVTGQCKPFALTGSLPIIADLKEQGYDVQITGFGAFEVRTCTGMLGHSRTRAVAARVWLWRTVATGCASLCASAHRRCCCEPRPVCLFLFLLVRPTTLPTSLPRSPASKPAPRLWPD